MTHTATPATAATAAAAKGFIVDQSDSSLTRSNAYLLELFDKANMQVGWGGGEKGLHVQCCLVRWEGGFLIFTPLIDTLHEVKTGPLSLPKPICSC